MTKDKQSNKRRSERWPFVLFVCAVTAVLLVWVLATTVNARLQRNMDLYKLVSCETIVAYPGMESLYRDSTHHKGSCFPWSGRVTQILPDETFVVQTDFNAPYANGQFVVFAPTLGPDADDCIRPGTSQRFLEGDHVSFVGEFQGIFEYEMENGPPRSLPSVFCRLPPNQGNTGSSNGNPPPSGLVVFPVFESPAADKVRSADEGVPVMACDLRMNDERLQADAYWGNFPPQLEGQNLIGYDYTWMTPTEDGEVQELNNSLGIDHHGTSLLDNLIPAGRFLQFVLTPVYGDYVADDLLTSVVCALVS